jgi:excisionase family DNA binding protein
MAKRLTAIEPQRKPVFDELIHGTASNESAIPLKMLLKPQEAADALSIDRSTLYELLMDGTIPSIKIGRARRIPVSALEQWIADQIAA